VPALLVKPVSVGCSPPGGEKYTGLDTAAVKRPKAMARVKEDPKNATRHGSR